LRWLKSLPRLPGINSLPTQSKEQISWEIDFLKQILIESELIRRPDMVGQTLRANPVVETRTSREISRGSLCWMNESRSRLSVSAAAAALRSWPEAPTPYTQGRLADWTPLHFALSYEHSKIAALLRPLSPPVGEIDLRQVAAAVDRPLPPFARPERPLAVWWWLASLGLALVTLAISLYPAPLIAYTEAAANLLGRP
jgi:hypothetical protein